MDEQNLSFLLANTNQKKVGVAMLISDRADFEAREVIRSKV